MQTASVKNPHLLKNTLQVEQPANGGETKPDEAKPQEEVGPGAAQPKAKPAVAPKPKPDAKAKPKGKAEAKGKAKAKAKGKARRVWTRWNHEMCVLVSLGPMGSNDRHLNFRFCTTPPCRPNQPP